MLYYIFFSYLLTLGIILGEISSGVNKNSWQLLVFLFAPICLPVVVGLYFVTYVNKQDRIVIKQTPPKIDVKL